MFKNISALLTALLLYIFCDPYFVWHWVVSATFLLQVILFGVLLPNLDIKTHGRKILFIIFTLLTLSVPFFHGRNTIGIAMSIFICTIPFSKEKFAFDTYNCFLTIYAVTIGVSGIVWLMAVVGAIHPTGTIQSLNELKMYDYKLYPLLVIANNYSAIPRFCGPFDEPGVVGTLSSLLLIIGKFNFKNLRLLVIFITGFFSLSFFFYGVVAVYYLIYSILVNRNKKAAYIIGGMLLLAVISMQNETMYNMIWSRFEWDASSRTFAGDDRLSEAGVDFFTSVIGTHEFYFGLKNYEYFEEITKGNFSLVMAILKYGFVFIAIYMGIFITYGWNYKTNIILFLLFLFVFTGTLYQRPCLFEPEFLFLFSLLSMSCGELLQTTASFNKK